MDTIKIIDASEGNLKHISLEIPKHQLVVFTGLSGSGKSTLLIDVLFNECQRQYLEAMSLQGIQKPKVERILNGSPAIVIAQGIREKNPRSTVGTQSDIYTDLRMIYEKLGVRSCPYCGEMISSADCREETEKINDEFHVYMYCSHCGKRMDKLTRTQFSFNTKEGACPHCEGLGMIHSIKKAEVVKEELSLEEGAVAYWEKKYGAYQISVYHHALTYYGLSIPKDIPVKEYSNLQKAILLEGSSCEAVIKAYPQKQTPKTVANGKFEGVYPILWRRLSEKVGNGKEISTYFHEIMCPHCHGERLNEISRKVSVLGIRLPQLSLYSFEQLYAWIKGLKEALSEKETSFVDAYLLDVETKLNRLIKVGLGYLSLDRQTMTLSGGELQRLRLAATLDSDLSGIIYILDEPTAGLHPKDTQGMMTILKRLRDLGNTVLVIEHDVDVMAHADHIIDMGPGAGTKGGTILAQGTLSEIKQQQASVTGAYLCEEHHGKSSYRKAKGVIHIAHANTFNLKDLTLDIPVGCLSAITGPSGSGKSTLVFEVLAKGNQSGTPHLITGCEQFDQVISITQSPISRMKRSNVATYCEAYAWIRTLFAKSDQAKKLGLSATYFSFNTQGGRCDYCEGLGYVENNMLFFADTKIICPQCHGAQFHDDVLSVKYRGYSIRDILRLSIEEAIDVFQNQKDILRILSLLQDVGLGYLILGQPLTTLSGGEAQRLKLAKELINHRQDQKSLYLMDEPTSGLHPRDIEHFQVLLDRMVDAGNSVIVVEHNEQLIRNCDWVIDLGEGGGEHGGFIMFEGTPADLKQCTNSVTAKYL